VVSPLNSLYEECWSVLKRFHEDLKEVTFVIVVNQNIQSLNSVQVLCDLGFTLLKLLSQLVVVSGWDSQELAASSFHSLHRSYDVLCS